MPTSDKRGLTREFVIARVDQPMWFQPGQTTGVTCSLGEFREGRIEIPQGKDVRFQVTIMKNPSTEPRP